MKRMIVLAILLVTLNGCAVQSSKAPQIEPKVAYALNLESEVTQLDKDYTTFFQDVGTAHKSGQISDKALADLNVVGNHLKTVLDEANRLTKVYATNYDSTLASQIGALISQATIDLSNLYTMRKGL